MSSDMATPRRPDRTPRTFSGDGSSGSTSLAMSSRHQERIRSLVGSVDSDATPRKASASSSQHESQRLIDRSELDLEQSTRFPKENVDMSLLSRERSNSQSTAEDSREESSSSKSVRRKSSRLSNYPELERMGAGRKVSSPSLKRPKSASTVIMPENENALSPKLSNPPDGSITSLRQGNALPSAGPGRVREERRKRSAMHEQEVSQMRSESRLGEAEQQSDGDDDKAKTLSRTRTSSYKNEKGESTATDTSGTEGAGPTLERQRRKKSSASSSGRNPVRTNKVPTSSSPSRLVNEDWEKTSSINASSLRRREHGMSKTSGGSIVEHGHTGRVSPRSNQQKILGEPSESSDPYYSPSHSSRRGPLPPEFRSESRARTSSRSRYRSDSMGEEPPRRVSVPVGSEQQVWPRGEDLSSDRSKSSNLGSYRRRRYASDAQASDIASSEKDPLHSARISVDASSISKHLSRSGRSHMREQNSPRDWDARTSPTDVIRQRKISASSSVSAKSSGGASDLHRSASRASLRRAHGRDVFDDERMPPLPVSSTHPLSPLLSRDHHEKVERIRALREKQEQIRDGGGGGLDWWNELDELRSRIEELSVDRSQVSESRTSSRASASRPRVTAGQTPSNTFRRTRPMTEPRRFHSSHDRAVSEVMPDMSTYTGEHGLSRGGTLGDASRPIGPYDGNGRSPVTPDLSGTIGRSSSRITGSGPILGNNRVPSGGRGTRDSSLLHERNLITAFDVFERHFSHANGSNQTGTPSSNGGNRGGMESEELIEKFREVSDKASHLNTGLRSLVQAALEAQIDAELAGGNSAASASSAAAFAQLEKGMSHLLKSSDEQMRSLTDGLIVFTRAERERDRLRRAMSSDQGSVGRPGSRLSSLASPETERVERKRGSIDFERQGGMELRRVFSQRERRDESARIAPLPLTKSNGSGASQASSDRSMESQRPSRRVVSGLGASAEIQPTSPYSPTPNPSKGDDEVSSPSLRLADTPERHRSTLGIAHVRSASELAQSPGSLARREKSSNTSSNATVKPPSSLSPRRPKLSFPSVSTQTATAEASAPSGSSGIADGEDVGDQSTSSLGDPMRSPSLRRVRENTLTRQNSYLNKDRKSSRRNTVESLDQVFTRSSTSAPNVQQAIPMDVKDKVNAASHASSPPSSGTKAHPQRSSSAIVPHGQALGTTSSVGLNAASRMIRSLGRGGGKRTSAQLDMNQPPSSSLDE